MPVVVIAALGRRRELGKDGRMPWHLPADFRHFQRETLGHPLIMGRRTFESTGALPGRSTVVVSRRPGCQPAGAELAPNLAAAIERARELPGGDVVFLCGGAEVYREGLPLADELMLTWIDAEFPADTFFPDFDPAAWREVESWDHPADAKNAHGMRFVRYHRAS